jgi:hypothetical protein
MKHKNWKGEEVETEDGDTPKPWVPPAFTHESNQPNQRPSNGRIVHFTGIVSTNPSDTPAIIVRTWDDTEDSYNRGMVNLRVIYDRSNIGSNEYETSVPYDGSETPRLRTWHWPPQVGAVIR